MRTPKWSGVRAVLRARRPAGRHRRGIGPETALEHMRIDKKVQAGRIRLVLLRAIGDAFVTGGLSRLGACRRRLRAYFG